MNGDDEYNVLLRGARLDHLDFYKDAPNQFDAQKLTAWVRKKISDTAQDDAVNAVFGMPSDPPNAESLELAQSCASGLFPMEIAERVAEAVYKEKKQKALELYDKIDRRVRALAYSRTTGALILAASKILCDDAGIFVPTDLLVAMCRRIAQSTLQPERKTRARNG